ncbi:MAG: thioredoxin domain-containing protein [Bacteriovorax sp.]|nr:thioredoxin domain-containing protein [Bacteriovorax sp.]
MISSLKNPVTEKDHHIGSLHALVVLVEYGDFECPHSSSFSPIVDQLINEFKSNICYVYRHFPLSNIRPHALLAALASEAADQQHEFWNFSEFLFKNYDYLSPELMDECAEGLNLNLHQFRKDMKSENLLERITKDFSGGVRSGVHSTPTIFLNDHRYDGPLTYESLRDAIQRMIDEGQATYI